MADYRADPAAMLGVVPLPNELALNPTRHTDDGSVPPSHCLLKPFMYLRQTHNYAHTPPRDDRGKGFSG